MKLSYIGTGKAATALASVLQSKGHSIAQAWAHTRQSGEDFQEKFLCEVVYDAHQFTKDTDVVLLAVKDDVAADVVKQFSLQGKIVATTSGFTSKSILQKVTSHTGVFYPFVSMTKGAELNFEKVLLMLEGSDEKTVLTLQLLAQSITSNARVVEEKQRQSLHLAAVIAQNFSNHLYCIAEQILQEQQFSFADLHALIASHTQHVLQQSPALLQTGPAIRHDRQTIAIQEKLLQQHPEWQKIYSILTNSIQHFHLP